MSDPAFKKLRAALTEVRDFYAGKGGTMTFSTPDGKGGYVTRELTLEESLALVRIAPVTEEGSPP